MPRHTDLSLATHAWKSDMKRAGRRNGITSRDRTVACADVSSVMCLNRLRLRAALGVVAAKYDDEFPNAVSHCSGQSH